MILFDDKKILESVFQNVKESFCSLWTFKIHDKTMEIITSFSTTNFKFISVFITIREDRFIVTDGGWLKGGEYDTIPDFDEDSFYKICVHYETAFDIESTGNYYFKSTKHIDLIPNLVYDMCHFLTTIVSISHVKFQEDEEKEARELFKGQADTFIRAVVDPSIISFNKPLDQKEFKGVRFNAIITHGNKLDLVKYATGSKIVYFLNSLSRAVVDFEIINTSLYSPHISKRITLINDTAEGFDITRMAKHIETLEGHTGNPIIKWTEKEKLTQILNN